MADPLDEVFNAKTPEEKELLLRKLRAEVARLEGEVSGKPSSPERVPAQPTEHYIVKSDGSKIENPNYKPPDVIQRPLDKPRIIGPEGQEQVSETVSLAQAQFDLTSAEALRKSINDAAAAARESARIAIAEKQLTAEQARDKYNRELDKIKLEGEAQMRALTARGQEISLRGQDISANVSQRGQDLDYEQSLSQQSTSMANALLPYMNAPGQVQSTNSLMAGGPPVPTQPAPAPWDPSQFPIQAAQAARAQMPGRYALPGAPAPVATSSSYVLPQ